MPLLTFKPKRIVVEAFQFGIDQPPKWYYDNADRIYLFDDFCIIKTDFRSERCNHGDYIIQSVSKEIFCCQKTVFEKTFESILKED